MPSVLTGTEQSKQQPKRSELITAKRSEIKILTEHCKDQPERGKYLLSKNKSGSCSCLGGPYYDLLLPYLGWNYLIRMSEQLCEDVKECHGIWLPHFLVDVVARDLFSRPTVAEPQKEIWRHAQGDASIRITKFYWMKEPHPFHLVVSVGPKFSELKQEQERFLLFLISSGTPIWTRTLRTNNNEEGNRVSMELSKNKSGSCSCLPSHGSPPRPFKQEHRAVLALV